MSKWERQDAMPKISCEFYSKVVYIFKHIERLLYKGQAVEKMASRIIISYSRSSGYKDLGIIPVCAIVDVLECTIPIYGIFLEYDPSQCEPTVHKRFEQNIMLYILVTTIT